MKPVINTSNKTKSGTSVVAPVAAGVGVAGITAGGLAYLAKKKKDKEKVEIEEEQSLLETENQDDNAENTSNEEDKEWLYGLGLGLAAKREDQEDNI